MDDRIVDIFLIVAVIAVIVLKICNVIKISWLLLLAPLWIPFSIGLILAFILGIWFVSVIIIDEIKEKENKK